MNGQWLGRYSGTIFINLDDMGSHYAGNVRGAEFLDP